MNPFSQVRQKQMRFSVAVVLNVAVVLGFFVTVFAIMSAERLAKIPEADLDPNGVFKYVLIRVHSKDDDSYVDIVRGYAWAEYHGRVTFKCLNECQEEEYMHMY